MKRKVYKCKDLPIIGGIFEGANNLGNGEGIIIPKKGKK